MKNTSTPPPMHNETITSITGFVKIGRIIARISSIISMQFNKIDHMISIQFDTGNIQNHTLSEKEYKEATQKILELFK